MRINTYIKAFLIAITVVAISEGQPISKLQTVSAFTTKIENDLFGGTDSRYTSGIEFSYSRSRLVGDRFYDGEENNGFRLGHFLLGKHSGVELVGASLALGQKVFTPDFVRSADVVYGDRPYGGWAYVNVGYHEKTRDTLRSISLSFGTVGPDSLAEDAQTGFHKFIDDHVPEGWGNQVENEFGVNLISRVEKRFYRRSGIRDRNLDLYRVHEVVLGSINRSVQVGLHANYGKNLPMSSGSARVEHSGGVALGSSYADYRGVRLERNRRAYWTGGANIAYVDKDLLLEGNSERSRTGIDPTKVVGELEIGFVRELDKLRFSFTYVYRTKEFDSQGRGQRFGAISVTML